MGERPAQEGPAAWTEVTLTHRSQKNGASKLPPSVPPRCTPLLLNRDGRSRTGETNGKWQPREGFRQEREEKWGSWRGKEGKRTGEGCAQIERATQRMKNETTFPLTIYGRHHNTESPSSYNETRGMPNAPLPLLFTPQNVNSCIQEPSGHWACTRCDIQRRKTLPRSSVGLVPHRRQPCDSRLFRTDFILASSTTTALG